MGLDILLVSFLDKLVSMGIRRLVYNQVLHIWFEDYQQTLLSTHKPADESLQYIRRSFHKYGYSMDSYIFR
jgi:hypothetical protein